MERRPSRFEVTPAKDDALSGAAGHRQILTLPAPASASASASASVSVSEGIDAEEEAGERTPPPPPPPKSILKKNNSFVFQHSGPMASPTMTPYSTVTGAEGRFVPSFTWFSFKSLPKFSTFDACKIWMEMGSFKWPK